MLILPDKNLPRARFLMPIPKHQWRTPSQAQQKDQFGNENQTRFRLTARLNDGFIRWRGWFNDRDDADAFLFALACGSLHYERELWDLPTPAWRPDLGELLDYDFVTVRFLTSTSTSNQTDTVPADWNSSNNSIETIASGGSGHARSSSSVITTGAGGAAYSKITNLSLTPSGSVTFHLEAGGAAVTASGTNTSGNTGGDCWYNGTTLAGSSVGSKGGVKGATGSFVAVNGGAGGDGASGVGSTKFSGGRGGNATGTPFDLATGGGGAAGPNGAGNNGGDSSAVQTTTAGGSGDAGSGGAAGTTGGGNGGNGTEFDASHGSGGGGGGSWTNNGTPPGGTGGAYGAGGGSITGGWDFVHGHTSGAGGQGLIVMTYTVASGGARFRAHIY